MIHVIAKINNVEKQGGGLDFLANAMENTSTGHIARLKYRATRDNKRIGFLLDERFFSDYELVCGRG